MTVRGVEIERRGPVGWIIINDYQATVEAAASDPDSVGVHEGVGQALDELRWDSSVRVVVLTGRNDGEFYRFSRRTHWDDPVHRGRLDPNKHFGPGAPQPQGTARRPDAHELLMLIEKPVVARVNGDAIGFGQSLLWGCDIVIARDDARIAWGHTGLGEIVDSDGEERGYPWAQTPPYGLAAILSMPPAKTKEYMMLSKVMTGKELADLGVFNYAVPADELDGVVDRIVGDLLRRPPRVLARIKAVCNKHVRNQVNLTEDLGLAYGILDFWEHAAAGAWEEDGD